MLNCQARQENNIILNEKYKTNLFKTKVNKINKLYVTYCLNILYNIILIVGKTAWWIHSTIHFV